MFCTKIAHFCIFVEYVPKYFVTFVLKFFIIFTKTKYL